MGKKHTIEFKVGTINGRILRRCVFHHGSTKDLEAKIYSQGVRIIAGRSRKAKPQGLTIRWVEIIKRALLMLLVETGRCEERYKATCFIDGEKNDSCEYSFRFLCKIKQVKLGAQAKENLFFFLQRQVRSAFKESVICFENYAMSMGQTSLFEKFRYLFTAFNSFYSGIIKYLPSEAPKEKKPKPLSEKKKIESAILKGFFKEKRGLLNEQSLPGEFYRFDLTNQNQVIDCLKKRSPEPNANLSYESFVLADYSYYLRCKYFHGEKPIPIVCAENDVETKNLEICVEKLSEFLFKNINELFLKEKANPD